MKKLLVSIALGATIVSTRALAQDQDGGRHGGWMQDMTRAQAQQMADSMFKRFDLNHDGVVTHEEAEQARAQMGFGAERAGKLIEKVFGSAQSLTLQQFEAQQLARFDRDDLNHDGVVTVTERQQARAALKAERAAQPQPAPQAPAPQSAQPAPQ
jgi:EF hand